LPPISNYVFKIILAGEGAVGKTTLVYRLKTGTFLDDTKMTIGVDFYPYKVDYNGLAITLQIWDLGGQERFQFMHESYTRGGNLAILVYDLTRHSTAERLLKTWLPMMRAKDKNLPILLVGSKLDLVDPQDAIKMVFNPIFDPVRAFDHVLISSKTGSGINECFQKVVEHLMTNPPKMK
jgi:small GTP-binding protein